MEFHIMNFFKKCQPKNLHSFSMWQSLISTTTTTTKMKWNEWQSFSSLAKKKILTQKTQNLCTNKQTQRTRNIDIFLFSFSLHKDGTIGFYIHLDIMETIVKVWCCRCWWCFSYNFFLLNFFCSFSLKNSHGTFMEE